MDAQRLAERVARLETEVIALRKKVGVRRAYLPPWLRGSVVDFETWVRGVRNPCPGENLTPCPSPLMERGVTPPLTPPREQGGEEEAVGDE